MPGNNPEILSPLRDFVFTHLFGDKRNLEILTAFLKSVLDIPESDYKSLTVENPLLRRLFKSQKSGIVDVRITTKSGRIIHIELQVNKHSRMRQRIIFYTTKLLWEQLKWGDEYDKIQQVISLVICDHILLDEETAYFNSYTIRNDNSKKHFTDLLKIITIELPRLPKVGQDKVWPWAQFLKSETQEEFESLAAAYPEVKMAVAALKKLSWGKRWRLMKEQESLWQTDIRIMKEDAVEEGKIEGKIEIALKLKKRGMPVTEIAEDTGLSLEDIEKL
jgi:predicted transposase/invertase (TIGR01784 family)